MFPKHFDLQACNQTSIHFSGMDKTKWYLHSATKLYVTPTTGTPNVHLSYVALSITSTWFCKATISHGSHDRHNHTITKHGQLWVRVDHMEIIFLSQIEMLIKYIDQWIISSSLKYCVSWKYHDKDHKNEIKIPIFDFVNVYAYGTVFKKK